MGERSGNTHSRNALRWGLLTVFLTSAIISLLTIKKEHQSYMYLDYDDGNDDFLTEEGGESEDFYIGGSRLDNNLVFKSLLDNNDHLEKHDNSIGGHDNTINEEDDEYLEEHNDLAVMVDPQSYGDGGTKSNDDDGTKIREEDDEYLEEPTDPKSSGQGETTSNRMEISPLVKLQRKIEQVEQMDPIPFYMYDHPNITLDQTKLRMFGKRIYRIGAEALFDLATIHALNMSSWRTNDPNEAKLYIIPIPMGRIASSLQMDYFDVTFGTLFNQTIFQRTQGHNHVLPASPFLQFRGDKPKQHGLLRPHMPKLWNVTIASSYDQNGIINAVKDGVDFDEYTPTFAKLNALSKKTFSIGLSGGTNFPLREIHQSSSLKDKEFPLTLATTEKFYNASHLIFYHTPANFTCFHNSTIHRMAPITNITFDKFPKSSIGHGINDRDLWIETYKDSKFCLCIRGDSPHSHAFFRSVRSGCIPVVASAPLPIYSPILKHTLDMEDYSIMLDEQELIQNTHNALLKLQDLDKEFIEAKIKNLQFAQRVWFHDHPESLFVKAYLNEALHASEVDDSLNPYGGDSW